MQKTSAKPESYANRIALLTFKDPPKTKPIRYGAKYQHIVQVLKFNKPKGKKGKKGKKAWETQAWNQSGLMEKQGKHANTSEDILLLPPNKSLVTYKGKQVRVSYNLTTSCVTLEPPAAKEKAEAEEEVKAKTKTQAKAKPKPETRTPPRDRMSTK